MKKLIVVAVLILLNCSSDDSKPSIENLDLLGKWKIIEQLVDPGDGSGTFQPINSNRIFDFFSNGNVTVNGLMCYMSSDVGSTQSGTYEENGTDETFYDGEISPVGCDFPETKLYYVIEGANLIIWYLCFEGCAEKYEKIK